MEKDWMYDKDDLGAVCQGGITWFKVWSPRAESVTLYLYKDGVDGVAAESHRLKQEGEGVWQTFFHRDLHGMYYNYEVAVDGESCLTADPYARACGINGTRSMVVDLKKTDPQGWNEDRAPVTAMEDIIYELHVKEFSWDRSGGFPEAVRGKYTAFSHNDTTLYGDGIHPTGTAYMKELGVTHVQLMPVFDYGSVDEAGDESQFNWGYDPVNYNVPEGSYATDAYHGEVRIRELKEMVMALHKQGFRVIMDVVYNHTYSADSWLERMAPGYYYRTLQDGTLSNGSGCGNDIASEKTMCSRYILDSVLYWVREYHMDGFRFDLMGLLDVELMNRIRQELDCRYGVGEKLIYGEPWAAAKSPMQEGSIPALKKNVRKLDPGIGIFCDGTRDAIRGHVFEEDAPGFVNGKDGLEENLLNGVSAWCDEKLEAPARSPSQIITYASAHDNLTLWDKLVLTMTDGADFDSIHPEVLAANKLAAAICYTCQGRMFLLSGEEFGRTKQGIDNSYQSSVNVNRLDWKRAYNNLELVEYYKGLMAFRKQQPGLCDKTEQAVNRIRKKQVVCDHCVSFVVDNRDAKGTDRWTELYVVYNGNRKNVMVELPEGIWEVLADGRSSSYWRCPEPGYASAADQPYRVKVSPVSALIFGKHKE